MKTGTSSSMPPQKKSKNTRISQETKPPFFSVRAQDLPPDTHAKQPSNDSVKTPEKAESGMCYQDSEIGFQKSELKPRTHLNVCSKQVMQANSSSATI